MLEKEEFNINADLGNYQVVESLWKPSVNEEGIISWTKDTTSTIPETKNIKGKDGKDGKDGKNGEDGYTPIRGTDYFDGINGTNGVDGRDGIDGYTPIKGIDYFDGKDGKDGVDGLDGATFTPTVSTDGNLSWTNDKGLTNPATINIKGPKGDQGETLDIDLDDYYTKEEVEELFGNIDVGSDEFEKLIGTSEEPINATSLTNNKIYYLGGHIRYTDGYAMTNITEGLYYVKIDNENDIVYLSQVDFDSSYNEAYQMYLSNSNIHTFFKNDDINNSYNQQMIPATLNNLINSMANVLGPKDDPTSMWTAFRKKLIVVPSFMNEPSSIQFAGTDNFVTIPAGYYFSKMPDNWYANGFGSGNRLRLFSLVPSSHDQGNTNFKLKYYEVYPDESKTILEEIELDLADKNYVDNAIQTSIGNFLGGEF